MAPQIVLHDGPDALFRTGSTISGHVELHVKKSSQRQDLASSKVHLSISGRSKIRITRRRGTGNNRTAHSYSSKALLFIHNYTLAVSHFAADSIGEGGRLSWPFEVHLPIHAESIPPETLEAHNADVFQPRSQLPYPFPGTIGYGETPPTPQALPDTLAPYFQHNGLNTDVSAGVRYKLSAEVEGLRAGISTMWMGNKEVECEIPVQNAFSLQFPFSIPSSLSPDLDDANDLPTYSQHANPSISQRLDPGPGRVYINTASYEETIRSLRLLPQHQERRLSLRERTRSVFKRSTLPAVRLRLTLAAPDTIYWDQSPDESLGIAISVKRVRMGESNATKLGWNGALPSVDEKAQQMPSQSQSRVPLSATPSTDTEHNSGIPANNDNDNDDDDSTIPTPPVLLKRLSLRLVAQTAVRTSPAASAWDREFDAVVAAPATLFEWKSKPSRDKDKDKDVATHSNMAFVVTTHEKEDDENGEDNSNSNLGPIQRDIKSPLPPAPSHNIGPEASGAPLSPTATSTSTSPTAPTTATATHWFDLARKLGTTHQYVHALASQPNFGLVSDFATPNLRRSYSLEWDVRVDVCGEEVAWQTGTDAGGRGLKVRIGPRGNIS